MGFISFSALSEARRGEAWRGVFWTLVGLRDDELAEFSIDGCGRGREGVLRGDYLSGFHHVWREGELLGPKEKPSQWTSRKEILEKTKL